MRMRTEKVMMMKMRMVRMMMMMMKMRMVRLKTMMIRMKMMMMIRKMRMVMRMVKMTMMMMMTVTVTNWGNSYWATACAKGPISFPPYSHPAKQRPLPASMGPRRKARPREVT